MKIEWTELDDANQKLKAAMFGSVERTGWGACEFPKEGYFNRKSLTRRADYLQFCHRPPEFVTGGRS
jgi:hypothetical protein